MKIYTPPEIRLNENINVDTILFAAAQILLEESENELQKHNHLLQKVARGYNMKISIRKTKTMAFQGK